LPTLNDLYPAFYRHVIHPLYHALKRDGLNALEREAFATDKLDADGLARLQREKFSQLLRNARVRSPYYSEVIHTGAAEAALEGTPPHALGLPVLTKSIIDERLNDLLATDPASGRLIAASTRGSAGEPTRFYTDLLAMHRRQAVEVRSRRWIGVPIGERRAILWGGPIDRRWASSARGRLHNWINGKCTFDAYDLSEARMADYLATMLEFGPRMLFGYPSAILRFGEWCEAEGRRIPSLRAIVTSAETLYEEQRARISQTMHAPVYDRYACREVGCIAHERQGVDGRLINADRVLIEILDEHGRPVPEGESGLVVVTDLDSHAMPLIRYEIGDLAIAAPPSETRTYPALAWVESHSTDVLHSFASGTRAGAGRSPASRPVPSTPRHL
jgi:phenylacetate-CoA ligase